MSSISKQLANTTGVSVAMMLPKGGNDYMSTMAKRLGISVVDPMDKSVDMVVCLEDGSLQLIDIRAPKLKPLAVDFVSKLKATKSLPIPKRGGFAQALGRSTKTIVDATAGWGHDTALMWLMGYQVVAVERSVIMGALLLDGLRRLKLHTDGVVPEMVVGDAQDYLNKHCADCVYLDPMFPPKRKHSAATRRSLRVLRELVGDDEDIELLFQAAKRAAKQRVVVKRPSYAPALFESPTHTFTGNMIHYDVYLTRTSPVATGS